MILYLNDWNKYPSAIVDTTTKNKSFLEYAGLLKKMGVKNHAFCLALHNPKLQGIDPYDPNLTDVQQSMIAIEVKTNPWYFFREIVRLPPSGGVDPIPFRGNRGNISLFWLFFNHVTTLLIQPRQTGKSVSTDCLMVLLLMLSLSNTQMNLLTKDESLRATNVARIKNIMTFLPPYLDLRNRNDANNTEQITVNALGNIYHTAVGQASEVSAFNKGRGMTLAINHIDELAFVPNIHITLPEMLSASGAARDNAAAANAPYGNIFTTTPGYLSSKAGAYAYSVYKECCPWTEHLYDVADATELEACIRKNSPVGIQQVLLEFNHRQLGYTDEWLRRKIEESKNKGEVIGANYLNIWAQGNAESPIDKHLLQLMKTSTEIEPYMEISKYGYITKWYIPEAEYKEYLNRRKLIMALDTSDAVGKDGIAMTLRDSVTAEMIAAGDYNETNLVTFSEWIADFLIQNENITLIIERKSSGVMIIDNLIKLLLTHGVDPFKRIFNWVVNDCEFNEKYLTEVIKVPFFRRQEYVYTKYRKEFGYATAGAGRSSRDNLYGTAFSASVKYTSGTLRDKILYNQLSKLVIKNNRIDHVQGEHDDMVISWLLGYWFLLEAKNKDFYGINPQSVLSGVRRQEIEEQGGDEAVYKNRRQLLLRAEIDTLIIDIKMEKNPQKIFLLTNRLKHLYKFLDVSDSEAFNIDTLLANIHIEKRKTA